MAYRVVLAVIGVVKMKAETRPLSLYQPAKVEPVFVGAFGALVGAL